MRTLCLPHLMVSLQFAALLSCATAVSTDSTLSVAIRSGPVCANAPHTAAGAMLGPRHGTDTVLWRAPGSQTYIILQMYATIAGDPVRDLLSEAMNSIVHNIGFHGDGLIPGVFNWLGDENLWLSVRNSNNHQITWGVLRSALLAVEDYMNHNVFGMMSFNIYDGAHEVGAGTLGAY